MIRRIHGPDRNRWTPQSAARLAAEACQLAGLGASDLALVRFGTNAVFEVVGSDLALRLRRPGAPPGEVARQVALTDWLVANGFPANRPAPGVPLLETGLEGAIASFWEWVPEDRAGGADVAELGALLRELHRLVDRYPAAGEFPQWDPLGEVDARLRAAEAGGDGWPSASQIELMDELGRQLRTDLTGVDWSLPAGLIHGDAHLGNVLTATTGANLLIDWDSAARGRREWDLVPTAVFRLRFHGDVGSIEALCAAYGFDLLDWSGWPTVRRLRELYITSWLLSVASDAQRRDEVDHRIGCLADGDERSLWGAV